MADFKLTFDQLDLGIEETIRLYFVASGNMPDITTFSGTAQQINAAYAAAEAAILEGGKTVVKLYGPGGYKSRGELKEVTIIINRSSPMPSQTQGVGRKYEYTPNGNRFDKSRTADLRYDVPYTLSYICQTSADAEMIETMFVICFGGRSYIDALNRDGSVAGNFWFMAQNPFDTSDMQLFMERGSTYKAMGIDLVGNTAAGSVAQFTDFTLSVEPNTTIQIEDKFTLVFNTGTSLFDLIDNFLLGYSMVHNDDGTYTITGPNGCTYTANAAGVITSVPSL
jgi:hypothetical protein